MPSDVRDSELREKNFKAFEERYGIKPLIDDREDELYKAEFTADGQIVIYILNEGANIRLNSSYDPEYEAKRWAQKYELLNRKAAVAVLGFSTGAYLKALINTFRPDTSYFVYEPEESLFSYLCKNIDITQIIEDKRVNLFITKNQHDQMAQALIWEITTYHPETIGVITPFYSACRQFEEICDSMRVYATVSRNYQRVQGRRSLECRMYAWNHMWNSMTVKELEKMIPRDIPAVIVSAGPSLNKNVKALESIKGHALIVCTDRALSVLDKNCIEPDLVASVDSEKDVSYLLTENIDPGYLLCSYQLDIESQKLFFGKAIFYYALNNEMRLLGDKADNGYGFDHGGNVSGSTFTILRRMGIKKFILVGQDLAYLDGKHHADGSDDGKPEMEIKMIEGIDGRLVESCNTWINFRNFFERQIALYPEIEVIDATEGGALIRGTKVRTLMDVAYSIKDKQFDVKETIKGLKKAQDYDEYACSVEIMEGWIGDLDRICDISLELKGIFNELIKICKNEGIGSRKIEPLLENMNGLRTEIVNMDINTTLERYWIKDMYSIPERNLMIRTDEEALPVFEMTEAYYEALPADCKSLANAIRKAIRQGKEDIEIAHNKKKV